MIEYLNNKTILNISGADVSKFLQGLVTKNILNLQSDLTYCLMLNSQGKYLYDMFLYRHEYGFFIEIFTNFVDGFISKLKLHKLRADINIEILHDYKILWTTAPFDNKLIDYSANDASHYVASYADPRVANFGYRTVVAGPATANSYQQNITLAAGDQPIGDTLYNSCKYQLAIPDFVELIQEKSFPLEYGFEKLNAIDFDKGCYIGQEPIARTFHRGVVRKNIFKLTATVSFINIEPVSDCIADSVTINIMAGNIIIGKILSYHNNIAIAQLRIQELADAEMHNIPITVMDQLVTVTIPNWRQ